MVKRTKDRIILLLLLLFVFSVVNAEKKALFSRAEKAIAQAKKENKYLVIYFYEGKKSSNKIANIIGFFKGENSSDKITKIMEKAKKEWSKKANFIKIEVRDSKEREVVRKCGVTQVPFTAVIAPNGAITARFPGIADLEILQKGFVSPKLAQLLKAVQAGNIVFLCLTNKNTKYGSEVLKTAKQAVSRLSGIVELIKINPEDKREISLLKQIKVLPDLNIATTLVIAPTGIIVEKFTGRMTQRDLFNSFQKILAMDSGCGAPTATGGSACDPSAGVGSSGSCE